MSRKFFITASPRFTGSAVIRALIEEIAWRNQWLQDEDLERISRVLGKSSYGKYLHDLVCFGSRVNR